MDLVGVGLARCWVGVAVGFWVRLVMEGRVGHEGGVRVEMGGLGERMAGWHQPEGGQV